MNRRARSRFSTLPSVGVAGPAVAATALILSAAVASAGDVFVDNFAGNDRNDGSSAEQAGERAGPVRTIRRGLAFASPGDTLHLANHGIPYYESMELAGARLSGTPHVPFTIEGNGAVLDGSRLVPPEAWQSIAGDIWRFTPWRKGQFQLLLDYKVVPEHSLAREATPRDIPPGKWSAWRGSIYLHAENSIPPRELPYAFAADQTGLSLYSVEFVRVRNLTIRNFRLDGANAHDLCRNVLFENVICVGNGRSGLSAGGTSFVTFRDGDLRGNRVSSFRIEEAAGVDLQETQVDGSPPGDPASAPPSDDAPNASRRAPSPGALRR